MAWKPKKKAPELSYAEKEYVRKKLEEYKTKYFKPIKGEIRYKAEGVNQEVVETARYYNEDDLKEDAKHIVDRMNEISKGKYKWILLSVKVLGKDVLDDDNGEMTNEEK